MKALRHTAPLLFIALAAAADQGTRFRAELVGTQELPAIFAAGSANSLTLSGRQQRRVITSSRS